jgi:hypothetical protein
MRRTILPLLIALSAAACDDYRGPRLAITTDRAGTAPAGRPVGGAPPSHQGPSVYGGKTAAEWNKLLRGNKREEVAEACSALHVLHREGREYLFQGLDSTIPETRRMCLETLTIADLKKLGDPGRQKLVKLSGDRDDLRIRERAAFLIQQWHGSIPAP